MCPASFDVARLVEQLFPASGTVLSRKQARNIAERMRDRVQLREVVVQIVGHLRGGYMWMRVRLIAIDILSRLDATPDRRFCIVAVGRRSALKLLELMLHCLNSLSADVRRHWFSWNERSGRVLICDDEQCHVACGWITGLTYPYVKAEVARHSTVADVLYDFDEPWRTEADWTNCVANEFGPCDVKQVMFQHIRSDTGPEARSVEWGDTDSSESSSSTSAEEATIIQLPSIESASTPDDEQNE